MCKAFKLYLIEVVSQNRYCSGSNFWKQDFRALITASLEQISVWLRKSFMWNRNANFTGQSLPSDPTWKYLCPLLDTLTLTPEGSLSGNYLNIRAQQLNDFEPSRHELLCSDMNRDIDWKVHKENDNLVKKIET